MNEIAVKSSLSKKDYWVSKTSIEETHIPFHIDPDPAQAYYNELSIAYRPGTVINDGRYNNLLKDKLRRSFVPIMEFPTTLLTTKELDRHDASEKNRLLEKKFNELKRKWKEATLFSSNTHEIILNSYYQMIIGIGPKAIPIILEDMRKEPNPWFWALKAISGDDPIPEEDRGNLKKMTAHWLNWGYEKGYTKNFS